MAKQKVKGKGTSVVLHSGGKAPIFLGERLFMKNGSVLKVDYITKKVGEYVTEYYGIGDIFLCEVQDAEVMLRASLNVPMEMKQVPSSNQPGAPLKNVPVSISGGVEVSGYQF